MNFRYECINEFDIDETAKAVFQVLKQIDFEFGKNKSGELKNRLNTEFKLMGWFNSLKVDPNLNWKIQYYYDESAILYYFSNKARASLDLVKIQHLYQLNKIKKSIYIVLCKNEAIEMGDNLANFETLLKETKTFNKIFTLPILLIGLYEK
jgi:hypothetical protein